MRRRLGGRDTFFKPGGWLGACAHKTLFQFFGKFDSVEGIFCNSDFVSALAFFSETHNM